MNHPLLVCGHGRCGSSLVMYMLDAGGYPVYGSYPDYEPEDVGPGRDAALLMETLKGKAAKILDPQHSVWPLRFHANIIWLRRDKKEQAKSQLKFLRFCTPGIVFPSGAWRKVAESFAADTRQSIELFATRGCPILELSFESIIVDPFRSAQRMDACFRLGLNVERAASVVIKRSAKCAKDCSIEEAGIASERERGSSLAIETAEGSANNKSSTV